MGLCKCPKKKVSNLFCYEHRINVCEDCLVVSHPRCIVQSYLQWLQDSDFDSTCKVCGSELEDETAGECIRLCCYDVFHWRCLDQYARQLPPNTAPAGYTCPSCSAPLFPESHNASPVAQHIRKLLSQADWARAGLGLPLMEEPLSSFPDESVQEVSAAASFVSESVSNSQLATRTAHSVVNVGVESSSLTPNNAEYKKTGLNSQPFQEFDVDTEDNKYKRRPAMQFLAAWFASRTGGRHASISSLRRKLFLLLLVVLALFTLLLIISRAARNSAQDLPGLDPMDNPNIRVKHDYNR